MQSLIDEIVALASPECPNGMSEEQYESSIRYGLKYLSEEEMQSVLDGWKKRKEVRDFYGGSFDEISHSMQ